MLFNLSHSLCKCWISSLQNIAFVCFVLFMLFVLYYWTLYLTPPYSPVESGHIRGLHTWITMHHTFLKSYTIFNGCCHDVFERPIVWHVCNRECYGVCASADCWITDCVVRHLVTVMVKPHCDLEVLAIRKKMSVGLTRNPLHWGYSCGVFRRACCSPFRSSPAPDGKWCNVPEEAAKRKKGHTMV